jgi:N-acetylmuramoyl-L-alanine amidase
MYLSGMKSIFSVFFFFFLITGCIAQDSAQHYFLVKTTGPLPFMEYGLGEDRLGGAKMTYLDSNIVLKVIDSTSTKYKVQLSKYHTGYVMKGNVKTDSSLKLKPYY